MTQLDKDLKLISELIEGYDHVGTGSGTHADRDAKEANAAMQRIRSVVEKVRGEDWENACHELFWETGNIEQFEIIRRLAEENAKDRKK